ncbi:MAG: Metallo-dependent phosphatase-like protein [Monoraphidium minutum]|nr:MAG: Metallo-dependent phosphatase-like protein [Monoraphidium minutum]
MERLPPDDEEAEDREFLTGFDRIERRIAARGQEARRVKYAKIGAVAVAVVIGALLVGFLGIGVKKAGSAPYTCSAPDGAAYNTTFFVIGDWGRLGNGDQRQAARMMADVAGCMRPDFILSTGDNFYSHGLMSASDRQFYESFVNVYSQDSIKDVPWYAVLGNHDYNDGIDPARQTNCAANDLANGSWAVPGLPPGLASITMLDTSPYLSRYLKEGWSANAGGIRAQNATAISELLRAALAAGAGAAWRFVVGHHPVASFGEHCGYSMDDDCSEMAWLAPLMQDDCAEMAWPAPLMQSYGVAAYFSGHDHDLQVIRQLSDAGDDASPPVWPLYVVSGGGSEVRKNEGAFYRGRPGYALPFFMDDQGFAAVRLNDTHAVIDMYASNRLGPMHTEVLAARPPPAAAGVRAAAPAAAAAAPAAAAPAEVVPVPAAPAHFGHGRRLARGAGGAGAGDATAAARARAG